MDREGKRKFLYLVLITTLCDLCYMFKHNLTQKLNLPVKKTIACLNKFDESKIWFVGMVFNEFYIKLT